MAVSPSCRPEYLPHRRASRVAGPGEFVFAAACLDHGHIYGQCRGLIEAGAELRWLFEPDDARAATFLGQFPGVRRARTLDEILGDAAVRLVAAAAIPDQRAALGARVMAAGKDYFTDKTPFTTAGQLAETRRLVAATGRKYAVYFSERLHVESAMHATDLVAQGVIGRVVQVLGLGPHRLDAAHRPAWFFDPARTGGILCDLACHQIEQFLTYTASQEGTIVHAAVANHATPQHPRFEDFGEVSLRGDTGASGYVRVDWLTPTGLSTWGDGRTFILGTDGYIELRKYVDVARAAGGDHLFLVNGSGEHHLDLAGQVGCRFFGELILDCLHRTERAMTQEHIFRVAELSLAAQALALRLPR